MQTFEKQRNDLKEDLTYVKSQSMRNNLVITNVLENNDDDDDDRDNVARNETAEDTGKKLRKHPKDVLKI